MLHIVVDAISKAFLVGSAEGGIASLLASCFGIGLPNSLLTLIAVAVVVVTWSLFSPSSRGHTSDRKAMIDKNVKAMDGGKYGFDVVIICTNTTMMAEVGFLIVKSSSALSLCAKCLQNSLSHPFYGSAGHTQYWQRRLEAGRGVIVPKSTLTLAVNEDWPGGAGNGLGTLYAWKKACALAAKPGPSQFNLAKALSEGTISCAIYHTAGKGTRLAPLPGSENNNKPGVKLPASLGEGSTAISILESVIIQTGTYASSRMGRLSVFWGDQVFIPSAPCVYVPKHHVDILCTLNKMPSAEEWVKKGLDKYGLIACGSAKAGMPGESAQVEKVSHATALRLLAALGEVNAVGASLGSFSVSATMLNVLMDEFKSELAAKKGKLDTDPGLWMPLTLSQGAQIKSLNH